jgi:hypothetical protein
MNSHHGVDIKQEVVARTIKINGRKKYCAPPPKSQRSDQENNKTQDYCHLQEFDYPLPTHSPLPQASSGLFTLILKKLARNTEILCIGL